MGDAPLTWVATKHDWVVGPKAVWPAAGIDFYDPDTRAAIAAAGTTARVAKYIPYHSISPMTQTWLEDWCVSNGYDPEDLYYHYYVDTFVRTGGTAANPEGIVVPGYGGGSATTLAEALKVGPPIHTGTPCIGLPFPHTPP